jgi:DNA helicase-2/ATP-dependent DNA helicase PcrA
VPTRSPDEILGGLNEAQREAATDVAGPLAIHAGAGTGKTRAISHRAAYAVATGAARPEEMLVVTFTEKAAGEMASRLRGLGVAGITARTFHAHALAQLRHFWPSRHDGEPLPETLPSKAPILTRLVRGLPGGYRFTTIKDLADEIEWAKSRRIRPPQYLANSADREPPIPPDLFARLYADYERAKARAGRLDFDDMLLLSVELLEQDEEAAATVRARKRWFSVDEYQDTSPLQERLLELWLGESRDLCVVGDEDQTIYSFTGASSDHLLRFADRHPGARIVRLTENYRSTPEILELANRVIRVTGRAKGLTATRPSGPRPAVRAFTDEDAELAGIVTSIRVRLKEGIEPSEIAVLVRTNAQIAPIEAALTRAGIPFTTRGGRFYERREVRAAIRSMVALRSEARGAALLGEIARLWEAELGYDPTGEATGAEARERQAAFETLLGILEQAVGREPAADAAALVAELESRREAERAAAAAGSGGAVELATLHRAKGLEWDAVFLPALEEGLLPIRQALDDPDALAEERRLLYVGITRARVHLAMSWASRRAGALGGSTRRPSRFLRDLEPAAAGSAAGAGPGAAGAGGVRGVRELPPAGVPAPRRRDDLDLEPDARERFERLRTWRSGEAREAGVPAYVIAPDETLIAVAELAPRTLAALRRCRGMGPTRLERYGDAILALVGGETADGPAGAP